MVTRWLELYRVGVDIGGTFTDLVSIDAEGNLHMVKVSTTPEDQFIGAMNAIQKARLDLARTAFLSHGSTVGVNAIIEGKVAKTGLVTTKGFRDVFEIRRGRRVTVDPREMYNLQQDVPQGYLGGLNPIVFRRHRFEVTERVNRNGEVLKKLNLQEARRVARKIKAEGLKAIAVSFIFSFMHPEHERRMKDVIANEHPKAYVSISSEILPIVREFERTSTTVINACIMPVVDRYLSKLENGLRNLGFTRDLHVMQSSGGIMTAKVARSRPVFMIDSGPAAGAIAASYLGNQLGYKNVISFDMGGTTAKVCLIEGGVPRIATEFWIGGHYFIGAPVMDLVEVGAGGGSIAWVDKGGALRVGPQSAGAKPGPACYRTGGVEPTVTDADLVLGYLNPYYFLGGEMLIDTDTAQDAIKRKVADPLNFDVLRAAFGIYTIVNANMTGGIRIVSVQRGFDPRDFALIAFGGAGPVHAARLAQEMHIPKVIVPEFPGVFSALGLLVADVRYDMYRSYVTPTEQADLAYINRTYQELEDEGVDMLLGAGVSKSEISLTRRMDMRYVGQAHEVTVAAPDGPFDMKALKETARRFHDQHELLYGHKSIEGATEIITLSVNALGLTSKPKPKEIESGPRSPEKALKSVRKVFFQEHSEYVDCPIYERSKLAEGNTIEGPGIMEQADATVVIPPKCVAEIDRYGNIIMNIGGP